MLNGELLKFVYSGEGEVVISEKHFIAGHNEVCSTKRKVYVHGKLYQCISRVCLGGYND